MTSEYISDYSNSNIFDNERLLISGIYNYLVVSWNFLENDKAIIHLFVMYDGVYSEEYTSCQFSLYCMELVAYSGKSLFKIVQECFQKTVNVEEFCLSKLTGLS